MEEKKRKKGIDHIGIAVVYVCHDGAGNILMQKRGANCRDEHGNWDIGGGGLEFGDTVEETLKREIEEEYGVAPIEYEFISYADVHRVHGDRKTHWIALTFKVLVDRSQVINNEPHKFDEIGWFRYESLPSKLHSQLPRFFEKNKEKIFSF